MRDALAMLDQASVLALDGKTIDVPDVLSIIGSLSEDSLFEIVDTLAHKKPDKLLEILNKILQSGNEPSMILKELTHYFRNLLLIKSCNLSDNKDELLEVSNEYVPKLKEQAELLGGIKTDLIEQGFKDALAQQSSLTQEQIEETLRALDQKVQEQMAAKAKAEAQQNLDAGSKFLEENAKKEGVVTTASGLQYKILKAGTGKKPTASDTISVKYKGSTIDGQVFDEQKEPVTFPLQNMIAGWVEGLQLMQEGSVFELYIPASLAYGENGAGGLIKPNSVLVFNVELVSVQPGAEPSGGAAAAAAAGADKAE